MRILLLIFLFSGTVRAEWGPVEIDSLVSHVITRSAGLRSVSAKIIQTRSGLGDSVEMIGAVDFVFPDSFRLRFMSPVVQEVLLTRDRFVQYLAGEKTAVVFNRDSLSAAEQEMVKKSVFVNIDHLREMRKGYLFSYVESWPDGVVLSAKPKTGWKNLSRILIKVDPETYCYRALELFDKNGNLVHQTLYFDYKDYGGSLFPGRMEMRMINGDVLITDRIRFSRIKINKPIAENSFNTVLPEGTRIVRSLAEQEGK